MTFDLSHIEFSHYDIKRNIKLPIEPSKKLAEFIGILAGDGHISFNTPDNLICITGDSRLDRTYLTKHVAPLFKNLFNVSPKFQFRKDQNTMYVRYRSKAICVYFDKIKYYKHKNKINIPNFIKVSAPFSISFVKGLADTDFSLMIFNNRKKKLPYPVIGIGTISEELFNFLSIFFKNNGFIFSIEKSRTLDKRTNKEYSIFRIKLSGRRNLKKWIKIIGFRNTRHLEKYNRYWRK